MRGQNQRFSAAQVASQYTGPDGYPNLHNDRALLPSANIGALIGRIGENGTPFLIGASYDQPIANDGTLFLAMNDIAQVSFRLAQPIFADVYAINRATGAFIVIDETTNNTVGAGMIV
mgnify:CR=1 FL=1